MLTNSSTAYQGRKKWLVFSAVSLAFFFLNLSTFTSLGVVLYTMVAELHWSLTAAGFSFSVLGLACGLSSPLPALTMRWFGGRATLTIGCGVLLLGFALASVAHSLPTFYVAMLLLGVGFSLAGNVPGVYLIAAWFQREAARIIGLYMMLGALGAAFGPPIVGAIVSGGGWRSHWRLMAIAAGVIGGYCLVWVRDVKAGDPAVTPAADGIALAGQTIPAGRKMRAAHEPIGAGAWGVRDAALTRQFLLVATSMAMTMACVTTYSSVTVTHLVKLGSTPAAAALVLSAIAIAATVVKGGAGRLCELMPSAYILSVGLILQAIGSLMLAYADTSLLQYASALTFGTGWGFAYVAGTVVLLDYFGGNTGSKVLSIVWLLTTVAAAGPLAAGMIADRFGSFAPIFQCYAVLLAILAVPIFVMRAPIRDDGTLAQTPASIATRT